MSNFYTDVIQKDPRFNSIEECRDMKLLEPAFRAKVNLIIAGARAKGITLAISETFRSQVRQEMLFKRGATQLEHVGVHGFGLACDFFKVIAGQASWAGDWSFLRDLAREHGIISGLDWGLPGVEHSFVDPDHIQGISVDDQRRLFAGTWYPASIPAAA